MKASDTQPALSPQRGEGGLIYKGLFPKPSAVWLIAWGAVSLVWMLWLITAREVDWSFEGHNIYNAWVVYHQPVRWLHSMPMHHNFGWLSGLPFLIVPEGSVWLLRLFSAVCGWMTYTTLLWWVAPRSTPGWLLALISGFYWLSWPVQVFSYYEWLFVALSLALMLTFVAEKAKNKLGAFAWSLLACLMMGITVLAYTPALVLVVLWAMWFLWRQQRLSVWVGVLAGSLVCLSVLHQWTPLSAQTLYDVLRGFKYEVNLPLVEIKSSGHTPPVHLVNETVAHAQQDKPLINPEFVQPIVPEPPPQPPDEPEVPKPPPLTWSWSWTTIQWLFFRYTHVVLIKLSPFWELLRYWGHFPKHFYALVSASFSFGVVMGLIWYYLGQQRAMLNTVLGRLVPVGLMLLCLFNGVVVPFNSHWFWSLLGLGAVMWGLIQKLRWTNAKPYGVVAIIASVIWGGLFITHQGPMVRFYLVLLVLANLVMAIYWGLGSKITTWANRYAWVSKLPIAMLAAGCLASLVVFAYVVEGLGATGFVGSDQPLYSVFWLSISLLGMLTGLYGPAGVSQIAQWRVSQQPFQRSLSSPWWVLVWMTLATLLIIHMSGNWNKILLVKYWAAFVIGYWWVQVYHFCKAKELPRLYVQCLHGFGVTLLVMSMLHQGLAYYHGQSAIESLVKANTKAPKVGLLAGSALSESRFASTSRLMQLYQQHHCDRGLFVSLYGWPLSYALVGRSAPLANPYGTLPSFQLTEMALFSESVCVLGLAQDAQAYPWIALMTGANQYHAYPLGEGGMTFFVLSPLNFSS